MLNNFKFFLLTTWLLSACVALGPGPAIESHVKTEEKIKFSLSFLDIRGRRIEAQSYHKQVIEELRKRYSNIDIETEYDDLRSGPNYAVRVTILNMKNMARNGYQQMAFLAMLAPIYFEEVIHIEMDFYTSHGEKEKLSRNFNYRQYFFIPLAPVGLYQYFQRPLENRIVDETLALFQQYVENTKSIR
jgi:hypothetical protein